jgi:FkbM family methyltransferase
MQQANKIGLFFLSIARRLMHILPFPGKGRLALFLSKIFLRNRTVCVPLRTGANMILNFQNKHEAVMYFDIFTKSLSKLQEKLLQTGDIFVDCGANVGYFSFFAAPIVTTTGKVIAIDANPYCIRRITESKTAGNHDNVEIKWAAIGEHSGQIKFNITDDPMYSSIVNGDKLAWTSTKESIDVKMEPLDKLLEDILLTPGQKIRLLKLDVEGVEIEAMLGAKNLFETWKIDYIHIEFHFKQLNLMGHTVDDVHSVMKGYGYHLNKTFTDDYHCLYSSPQVSA